MVLWGTSLQRQEGVSVFSQPGPGRIPPVEGLPASTQQRWVGGCHCLPPLLSCLVLSAPSLRVSQAGEGASPGGSPAYCLQLQAIQGEGGSEPGGGSSCPPAGWGGASEPGPRPLLSPPPAGPRPGRDGGDAGRLRGLPSGRGEGEGGAGGGAQRLRGGCALRPLLGQVFLLLRFNKRVFL